MPLDTTLGEIRPEILYHVDRVCQLIGWGKHTMRAARRNGLRVKYAGRRCYVHGRELIRYIEEQGKDSKDG